MARSVLPLGPLPPRCSADRNSRRFFVMRKLLPDEHEHDHAKPADEEQPLVQAAEKDAETTRCARDCARR